MNGRQYIEQQTALGYRLHEHDGIWWEQQSWFHCQPAIRLEPIVLGAARPATLRALAGYRHVVPLGVASNGYYSVMRMAWENERPFTMSDLSSRRRSQVRRGLKKNVVRQLTKLETLLEDVRSVVVSTRERTGVGLPVSYYTRYYSKWRQDMLRLFALRDRPWWGAFVDGRLIAYFQVTIIEQTLFIGAAKSHTDYLAGCPNDALLYSVLEDAINARGCRTVIYGDWAATDERLTYFKESYGFAKYDFPEYIHVNPLARPVLKVRRALREWRSPKVDVAEGSKDQ